MRRLLVWIPLLPMLLLAPLLSQQASAAPKRGDKPLSAKNNPSDGAEMVLIPAGEFMMGSANNDKGASADQKPRHKVYLDAFWIYKYDVTVAQYREFCTDTGRTMRKYPDWLKDNHPIVVITWEDAKAYADWAGVSLPTEAQWEKAARAGGNGNYVWGNTWPPPKNAGNYADEMLKQSGALKQLKQVFIDGYNDGYVYASPVGAFPPNRYGLYDMAGNVWQWCSDWYAADYYRHSPKRNPTGPATGTERVLRGGSWYGDPLLSQRVAARVRDIQTGRDGHIGFRCVAPSTAP